MDNTYKEQQAKFMADFRDGQAKYWEGYRDGEFMGRISTSALFIWLGVPVGVVATILFEGVLVVWFR